MQNRPGFSLTELLVGLVVASLIGASVVQMMTVQSQFFNVGYRVRPNEVTYAGVGVNDSAETATDNEGTNRVATATFEGKGGPALLMIAGPLNEWAIEMVDTFVASIQ